MNSLANRSVAGSIDDCAAKSGQSRSLVAANIEAVVACDYSGSMAAGDSRGGMTRWEAMSIELRKLQASYPGKILVIGFSDNAYKFYNGMIPEPHSSTNMVDALDLMEEYDDTGIVLFMISDGAPDAEDRVLQKARTFKSKINTIFVGPEGDEGAEFLKRLAKATGGVHQDDFKVQQLAAKVDRLLLKAG